MEDRPPSSAELKEIGKLDTGGFGQVTLQEDGRGRRYSLKAVSKGQIETLGMESYTLREMLPLRGRYGGDLPRLQERLPAVGGRAWQ